MFSQFFKFYFTEMCFT